MPTLKDITTEAINRQSLVAGHFVDGGPVLQHNSAEVIRDKHVQQMNQATPMQNPHRSRSAMSQSMTRPNTPSIDSSMSKRPVWMRGPGKYLKSSVRKEITPQTSSLNAEPSLSRNGTPTDPSVSLFPHTTPCHSLMTTGNRYYEDPSYSFVWRQNQPSTTSGQSS